MKDARLDINETTLVFEYPGLYYLDINLGYKVDSTKGNAKFDKSKKTLTIRVPVVSSTDQSEKVLEQHYRDYKIRMDEQKVRLKTLRKTELDETIKACRKAADEDQENEDPNEAEAELDRIEEAMAGVSRSKTINMGDMESIDDKYDLTSEREMKKSGEKRDDTTVSRENFLNIYKTDNGAGMEDEDKEIDLSSGIKLNRDDEEDPLGLLT